jgi:hypothetical protein
MKSKILGVAIALGLASSLAHAQSLEQQAQCAAQARVAANQENSKWEQTSSGIQTISFDHESHFNTKLNKCFIVTRRTFNVASILHWNTNLYDAFEGRDYALFMRSDRNPHKPMVCQLLPTYGQTTNCNSEEDFNAFIAPYMTQ